MTMDWQTIIVALLILGAVVYVGRRGMRRLRAFGASKAASASCDTGCGSCDGATARSTTPVTTLIQINRPGTTSGQRGQN